MSINGYLMAGRINFIAAIFGVILTGILYWKLDIRKACSMLYDLPIKPKPAKPQKQPNTKKVKASISTTKCEEDPKLNSSTDTKPYASINKPLSTPQI